jgi:hypothetical protein
LLLTWFVVTALLVNHDLVIRPVQPIHFSRGYLWIPLMLLGLPTIMSVFARLRAIRPPLIGILATAALLLVFLFDNASWIAVRSAQALGVGADRFGLSAEPGSAAPPGASSVLGFGLTRDQLDVLRTMNVPANRGFVVVSADSTLGYLTTVYSPLRSWRSHHYNTPYTLQRQTEIHAFFDSAKVDSAWDHMPILFVFRRNAPRALQTVATVSRSAQLVLTNPSYFVLRKPAAN